MPVSANLKRLIDANAPLWAGEAEIVRSYWTSPVRSPANDKLWLKRQCWKEYAGIGGNEGKTPGLAGDLASSSTACCRSSTSRSIATTSRS